MAWGLKDRVYIVVELPILNNRAVDVCLVRRHF